jgi:peptidoglycan-associated lipoprotein
MRHRIGFGICALFAFGALVCCAQQGNQQTQTGSTATVTRDEAGRLIQPVGTESPVPTPSASLEQIQAFHDGVKDVYFDFNRADLTPAEQAIVQQDAEWLKSHPDVAFTIEGDADERGDIVYNVFLSDQRALETRNALVKLGIPESRILYATGWGKLYPVCTESNESCWSKNRRSHLAPWSSEDLSKRAQAARLPNFIDVGGRGRSGD